MRRRAPENLQEAKPKAGSISGCVGLGFGSQTGVKPRSRRSADALRFRTSVLKPGTRRKPIGANARHKRQVGPDRQKCRDTRWREQTCEGYSIPGAPPGEKLRKEGEQNRPAGPRVSDRRSGTPRQGARWCMTRSDGTSEAVALEMVGSLLSARSVSPGAPAREIAGDGGCVIS